METQRRTADPGTESSSAREFPPGMAGFPSSIIQITSLLQHYLPIPPQPLLQRFQFLTHPVFNLHSLNTTLPTSKSNTSPGPDQNHDRSRMRSKRTWSRPRLGHLLIAATLNHLRRTFAPWLGQWIWYSHPLDDLRLALSNPEVFMGEMLGYSWLLVVESLVLRFVWDFLAGWVCLSLVRLGGERRISRRREGLDGEGRLGSGGCAKKGRRGSERKGTGETVGGGNRKGGWGGEVWTDMARVGYLLWIMVAAEFVFARSMNTAAWLVACYKLLAGGEVGRVALGNVVSENWIKIPLVVWQLGWYLRYGLWPLFLGSLSCAVRGRPGLLMAVLGCVGSVVTVQKYRSTFYIALELSNMFVFLVHLLVGSVVLWLDSFHDASERPANRLSGEPGSQNKVETDDVLEKKEQ